MLSTMTLMHANCQYPNPWIIKNSTDYSLLLKTLACVMNVMDLLGVKTDQQQTKRGKRKGN
jgi:hypothetical protein